MLFLTTFSVYLGLVLVSGASPQVLAQAVSEKKVETIHLTEEAFFAEYVSAFQSLFVLSRNISAEYSDEIKAIHGKDLKNGEHELNGFYYIDLDSNQAFNGLSSKGKHILTFEFFPTFEKLHKIFPQRVEEKKPRLKINLALTKKDFSLKVTAYQIPDEQADQFFNSLGNELSRTKIQQADQSWIILQNTEISKENNQILIVTRLPRGSLDELVKQDAKAESK